MNLNYSEALLISWPVGMGYMHKTIRGGVVLQGLESVNNENGAWYLLIRL